MPASFASYDAPMEFMYTRITSPKGTAKCSLESYRLCSGNTKKGLNAEGSCSGRYSTISSC